MGVRKCAPGEVKFRLFPCRSKRETKREEGGRPFEDGNLRSTLNFSGCSRGIELRFTNHVNVM